MLTRRDFLRVSSGAAVGAVLAGLGLSTCPTKACAEVAITGATVGLVIAGILAAYGIGTTNYNLGVELGVPEVLGNAFLNWSQDAKNYNAAVTAANSRISEIPGGVGFTDTELYDSISSASYLDGLSSALDPSTGLSLDWLNARGVDQAALYGLVESFANQLKPSAIAKSTAHDSSFVLGDCDAVSMMLMNGVSSSAIANSKGFQEALSDVSFSPAAGLCYSRVFEGQPGSVTYDVFLWPEVPTFTVKSDVFKANYAMCANISPLYIKSSDTLSSGSVDERKRQVSIDYFSDSSTRVFSSFGFELPLPSDVLVSPGIGSMQETTTDVGDVGFGGAIIGDGFTADNGMVTGFGSLPVFNPAYQEGAFPGVIDYPYPSALLDWRTGVFNPNDVISSGVPVTDIPGVAAPVPNGIALPTDIPVTVGIPLSDGIAAPTTKTLTLDRIIADGLETSITGTAAPSVPGQGTPFYPVIPPGSSGVPSSELPFQGIGFQDIFPFNMLYSLLSWVGDNL